MTGHRRHQQNLAARGLAPRDVEADQVAEGAFLHHLDLDRMVAPVGAGHDLDVPVGLDDHALEAAFHHLAPGGGDLDGRIRDQPKLRVGTHRAGGRAEPLVGHADRFHHVVCK